MKGWVIVAGDFAPHGGMDRANLELARYLAAHDRVHLVAHRAVKEATASQNVTFHSVCRPFGKHLLGKPFLATVGKWWATRLGREGYRVIVNGGNCLFPDLNWVHCVHAAYRSTVNGGMFRRARSNALHRYDRWSERSSIRSARLVICNSHRTARDAIGLLGVNPSRVRVIYLGCDPTSLNSIDDSARAANRTYFRWEDRPWVGFVGQFGNRVKGFDTLYAAWLQLCAESRWDANLAVIGGGPDRSEWIARAKTDGLGNRIQFLGFRTDVPEILACCDVLVAPSRYDAYGVAVHEAVCRGLPALVSSAAGVSERFPRELEELILRDPDNPLELADRLRHWRENRESLAFRMRPFSDELRSRTWVDMAKDIREAVLQS